jgi:hypothetical protein
MSDEKQYLDEVSQMLAEYESAVRRINENDADPYGELYRLISEAVEQEKALRGKHKVGERFNVIRTQLLSTLEKYKDEYEAIQQQEKLTVRKERKLQENETIVYLYLFNAQGNAVEAWQNMLTPRALFDYSVNRPIYLNKEDIERVIRARPNKAQHAYIEVVIDKEDIMEDKPHDQYQHPLLRVRQGAIKDGNILFFCYRDKSYSVRLGKIIDFTAV